MRARPESDHLFASFFCPNAADEHSCYFKAAGVKVSAVSRKPRSVAKNRSEIVT